MAIPGRIVTTEGYKSLPKRSLFNAVSAILKAEQDEVEVAAARREIALARLGETSLAGSDRAAQIASSLFRMLPAINHTMMLRRAGVPEEDILEISASGEIADDTAALMETVNATGQPFTANFGKRFNYTDGETDIIITFEPGMTHEEAMRPWEAMRRRVLEASQLTITTP